MASYDDYSRYRRLADRNRQARQRQDNMLAGTLAVLIGIGLVIYCWPALADLWR